MRYNFRNNEYNIDELEYIIANNHISKNDWMLMSTYQRLTEVFIEKFSDRVDWYRIVRYQLLSYTFLEKYLYNYSLCIPKISSFFVNTGHIIKLQEVYKDKYNIDKLEYELNKV